MPAPLTPPPGDARIAPDDGIWVCGACGKTAIDRYGIEGEHSYGWDESCMLNAVLCKREGITPGTESDEGRPLSGDAMTSPTEPTPIIRETDGHALALAIAKAAGFRECPNIPNAVCCCPPGRCDRERHTDNRRKLLSDARDMLERSARCERWGMVAMDYADRAADLLRRAGLPELAAEVSDEFGVDIPAVMAAIDREAA